MPIGVAERAERAHVPKLVAPATLAGEHMVDLGGERPALDAGEAVTLDRLRPEPSPSSG